MTEPTAPLTNGRRATDAPAGDVHAAIDIGTNSIHLVVARADASGGFEVLTTDKEAVRLGEGSGDMAELTDAAMDRGVAALRRFRQIAESRGADIAAVATSAVREADNRAVFLDRAYDEAGVDVAVISGTEEARLIHLGVLQALPIFDQQILTIDIGGGSTEFVVGRAAKILASRSVRLGHIGLTDRFFPNGVVEPGALDECRRYVRAFLAPVGVALGPLGHQIAAGSSGTISALADIIAAQADERTDRPEIDQAGLGAAVEHLASIAQPEDRCAETPRLDAKRSDVILGGAVLLEQIFERFSIDKMLVSEYALREGVLLDRAHGDSGGFHHLNDIRSESVLRFADAFDEDRSHVEHSRDLSLQLFDELEELHGFGLFERDILEAAGLLHNVGLFVSHAAHHKHSYYLIRNSDRLAGFTDREIELIAQVARYHRRSPPKDSHQTFMAMSDIDKERVEMLAGILRVGIALDRTRSRAIAALSATTVGADTVAITVERAVDGDASLELYTAAERLDLLSRALGRAVTITS